MRKRETGKGPFVFGDDIRKLLMTAILVFAVAHFAYAGDPAKPTPGTKCPVCGMFVAKYPDWVGQIHFKDGTIEFFDGSKDLFKYYFELKKYRPGRTQKDIADIYVTEYYDFHHIDARKALFVIGSDVFGPMGRELIPLATQKDAEGFLRDHKGKRILSFEEITVKVIQSLD
jgi:copper chaperone NosL